MAEPGFKPGITWSEVDRANHYTMAAWWKKLQFLNFIYQLLKMYATQIDPHRDFAHFLYKFLRFEVVMTSEDYMTASVDILRGQGNLNAKNRTKIVWPKVNHNIVQSIFVQSERPLRTSRGPWRPPGMFQAFLWFTMPMQVSFQFWWSRFLAFENSKSKTNLHRYNAIQGCPVAWNPQISLFANPTE